MANSTKTGNPVVTSLPDYVEENKIGLIAKAVLGGNSVDMFNLQTSVLGKTAINLLNTDITLQDAEGCGFDAQGSQTLSQRYIEPKVVKLNMEYCDKNLLGTWAQYQVKIAAGKEVLPFEEQFIGDVIAHVNDAVEKTVWQGKKATAGEFDGILEVLKGASKTATKDETSNWKTLQNVYFALPQVAKKEDTAIFVSPEFYEAWIQEMIEKNMFHIFPNDAATSVKLPGTSVDVIKVNGLTGANKIVAGRKSNVYIGVDMSNDKETFDFWYSKDDRVFRLAIEFSFGVQVAFPDEMVVCSLS